MQVLYFIFIKSMVRQILGFGFRNTGNKTRSPCPLILDIGPGLLHLSLTADSFEKKGITDSFGPNPQLIKRCLTLILQGHTFTSFDAVLP